MTRLDDALRGLPATDAARIKQAVRADQAAQRRSGRRVSFGERYTPERGALAGVEFRNRGEAKQWGGLVSEANRIVRENAGHMPEAGTPEHARLTNIGHRLFARVHRDDRSNRDNWIWLIEGWY